MQYVLLLYDDERINRMPEAEQGAAYGEFMAYTAALREAGVMVSGEPLDDAATAKTLRPGDQVEDGPFAEAKEQLGGFYIIDVATIEEALHWARRCPIAKWGHIEVRPIPSMPG